MVDLHNLGEENTLDTDRIEMIFDEIKEKYKICDKLESIEYKSISLAQQTYTYIKNIETSNHYNKILETINDLVNNIVYQIENGYLNIIIDDSIDNTFVTFEDITKSINLKYTELGEDIKNALELAGFSVNLYSIIDKTEHGNMIKCYFEIAVKKEFLSRIPAEEVPSITYTTN